MNTRQRITLTTLAASIMFFGTPVFAPAQEATEPVVVSDPAEAFADSIHAEIAGGGGAVWLSKRVNVEVYAGDYMTPKIVTAVRDIEGIMPAKGPRFRIKTHDQVADCLKVRRRDYKRPTITFCERESMSGSGTTVLRAQHHAVKNDRAWVELLAYGDDDPGYGNEQFDQNTACHEMMHAVSWVNDNYNYNKDSCVQGQLPHPGPWDQAYLQTVYRKHDDKQHQKQHERRRDHRTGRRHGHHGGRH